MNKYQALVDMIEHGNSKGALEALEKLRDEDREKPKSVEKLMTEFDIKQRLFLNGKYHSMKNMSTWLKQDSFEKKDEYYTPKILVEPIIQYVPQDAIVWCPFDTEKSEFVITLREAGVKVITSHIWNNQDFFTFEPKHYTHIISNPPFTKKLLVLDRLYSLGKPFAILLGLPILNYQEIGDFFLGKDLQLLIVNKKVSFDGNTASFNNSYFCKDFLPKDIIFTSLKHNNSKKHFVKSRMTYDL